MADVNDFYWAPLEIPPGRIFHIAMAVPDLPGAMALLGPALGAEWTVPREFQIVLETAAGRTSTPITAAYTRKGPPFIELISAPVDSFFGAPQGPRLHHAGIFIEDVDAELKRLKALGMTIYGTSPTDPARSGFVTNEAGVTLEFMSPELRNVLHEWFAE